MCYTCYVEEYGKPEIVNDLTKAAAKMVKDIGSWSVNCHIVVDDFNIEDEHIDSSIKNIESGSDKQITKEQRSLESLLMHTFKIMSVDERASALAIEEGWIS